MVEARPRAAAGRRGGAFLRLEFRAPVTDGVTREGWCLLATQHTLPTYLQSSHPSQTMQMKLW